MKHRAVQHLFLAIAVLVGIGTSGFARTFTLQQPTISLNQMAGLLTVATMSFLELQLPGAQPQLVNAFIPQAPEERKLISQPEFVVIEPQVFIYHSHNRESWLPELNNPKLDKPRDAFHAEKNVIKQLGNIHDLRGADMYVVRISRDPRLEGLDQFVKSNPCPQCTSFLEKCIKEYGLKNIYYA